MCEWVIKAWESIPADMLMRSFLKYEISNSMDGTEDDALFNEFTSGSSVSDSVSDSLGGDESDDSYIYDPALTEDQVL